MILNGCATVLHHSITTSTANIVHSLSVDNVEIAVVIPLYNGEEWIEDTISSVLCQTCPPEQIIVVDDGSEDRSPEIADSFSEVTLLHTGRQGLTGPGAARRLGWKHAFTPLISFLDQDDLWHPSHLETLRSVLRDNPEHPAAFSTANVFGDERPSKFDTRYDNVVEFDPWNHFPKNKIGTPSQVLIRSAALDQIGGWPDEYLITDFPTWLKLSAKDPMLKVENSTICKRDHKDSSMIKINEHKNEKYISEYIDFSEKSINYKEKINKEKCHERIITDILKEVKKLLYDVEIENKCKVEKLIIRLDKELEKGKKWRKKRKRAFDFAFGAMNSKVKESSKNVLDILTEYDDCGAEKFLSLLLEKTKNYITKEEILKKLIRRPVKFARSEICREIIRYKVSQKLLACQNGKT